MKHSITRIGLSLGLAIACLPLTACMEDGYNYRVGSTWYSSPYDVYYDGHYGPFFDGYWGVDNYFYYRNNDRGNYRRGNPSHFRRQAVPLDKRFRRYQGQTRQPSRGTRMPNYPGRDRRNGGRSNERRENRN